MRTRAVFCKKRMLSHDIWQRYEPLLAKLRVSSISHRSSEFQVLFFVVAFVVHLRIIRHRPYEFPSGTYGTAPFSFLHALVSFLGVNRGGKSSE